MVGLEYLEQRILLASIISTRIIQYKDDQIEQIEIPPASREQGALGKVEFKDKVRLTHPINNETQHPSERHVAPYIKRPLTSEHLAQFSLPRVKFLNIKINIKEISNKKIS